MTDRAVSDVLGYVLVFSLIVSTIGMVYTTGVGGLNDVREAEKLSNGERAFDVLDSNLADLVSGTANVRATEVKLEDATLGFSDPVTVTVSVENGSSYEAELRPVYFSGTNRETRIVAANGAVFRQQGSEAVLRNEPDLVVGSSKAVVPLLLTRTRASDRAGSGHVLVRTKVADRAVVRLDAPDQEVTITVESPRAGAWADYLEAETGQPCSVSSGIATCTIDTETVYVQVVRIDVTMV